MRRFAFIFFVFFFFISIGISKTFAQVTRAPSPTVTPNPDVARVGTIDIRAYAILLGCYGSKAGSATCLDSNKDHHDTTWPCLYSDINCDGVVDGIDYNYLLRAMIAQAAKQDTTNGIAIGPLTITSNLTIQPNDSSTTFTNATVIPNGTLKATVMYTNTGSNAITIDSFVIAARPPGGTNTGGPFLDFAPSTNNVTLAAGQSVTIAATRKFGGNDSVGAWYSYPTLEYGGKWYDGPDIQFNYKSTTSSTNPTSVPTSVIHSPTATPIVTNPPQSTGPCVPNATTHLYPLTANCWHVAANDHTWWIGSDSVYSYLAKNVTFDGSGMHLIANREQPFTRVYDGKTVNWSTGYAETKGVYKFLYGQMDFVATMPMNPNSTGYWPALWLLNDADTFETDVLEMLGNEPHNIYTTLHWGYQSANGYGQPSTYSSTNFAQGNHVFSAVWQSNRMDWYVDCKLAFTLTPGDHGAQIPNDSMYLIVNNAWHNGWGTPPNSSTTAPQSMDVHAIRILPFQNGTGSFVRAPECP